MDWKEAAELTKKIKSKNSGSDFVSTVVGVLIAILFILILGVPLAVYCIWAHVFVLRQLWEWFMVSTFNLDPLTWGQAWGLVIVVAFLTHVQHTCKSKDEREPIEKVMEFVSLILKPWIALGIGWICYHYFIVG